MQIANQASVNLSNGFPKQVRGGTRLFLSRQIFFKSYNRVLFMKISYFP